MTCTEIIFEIIKITGAIVGLILIIHRINLTKKVFVADHLRRKKESTLTAYNAIRDSYREINDELCSKLNVVKNTPTPISKDVLMRINNEDSHRVKVTTLLGYIQRFAVGVQHDIYDKDVLWDLSGSSFITVFERYRPYLIHIREKNKMFCMESDIFIESLKERSNIEKEKIKANN